MDKTESGRAAGLALVASAYLMASLVALLVGFLFGDQHLLLIVAAADLAATIAVFGWSLGSNNSSVYDPYWSVAPVPIALFLALSSAAAGASTTRQAVVVALVAWWALRLTFNWIRRWHGKDDEDWRYADMRPKAGAYYWPVSFLAFHLMPTVVVFLGCLSLYPALVTGTRGFGLLDMVAAAVTAGAILLETTADRQLSQFVKSRPGPTVVLDAGLWRFSRHPNYLGEVLFWWGLSLFAVAAAPASILWAWVGPVAMTALFLFISIPMMDKRMLSRRPAYADRMRRVSALLLWPPRRR